MADEVTPWAPARPVGADAVGARLDAGAGTSGPGWLPPRGSAQATRASSDGRARTPPPRRRLPVGRRIALAYLTLAAVIALVVVAGAASQPVYGSLAPYGGTALVDLRSAPTTDGWSGDMSQRLAPSLPKGCLNVSAGGVDGAHELITAQLPSVGPNGENAACEAKAVASVGRVMMVDPATGRTLWTRDLGALFGTTVFSVVWHRASVLDGVVVGVDGGRGSYLVLLDARTGAVVDRAPVASSDAAVDFAVSGHLVLSAEPNQGGELTTYELRRADSLSRVLWRQQVSASTAPQLLPDRLLVPLPKGTISIDGVTGRVSSWATDLQQIEGARVVGDTVLGVTVPQGVGLGSFVVRLDASGRQMWEVPALAVSGLAASRTCVLMSSVTTMLSCIDPASGRIRWSIPDSGAPEGTPTGATTADVEVLRAVHSGDTSVSVADLDGATGRARFSATLPRGAVVAGQSTGTAYAIDSSSGVDDALTAFDTATGRVLWTYRARTIELWGGHLVATGRDGVTRELTDAGSNAWQAPSGHDMLDG